MEYSAKDLWLEVKPTARWVEREGGVLIFDDTIQEKAWADESELRCWRFDPCSGRTVRGINLLSALYHCKGSSIPVAFERVKKPVQYSDITTRKLKRKSDKTQNEMMRERIATCIANALKFRFVLMGSWFFSEENFDFITGKKKHFIAALKDNRLLALSEEGRKKKRFIHQFLRKSNMINDKTKVAHTDRMVAEAIRNSQARELGYREQALKIYHWICGRCAREFSRENLQQLTVHHKDHDHNNNPVDGSNWELLCLYCHDNEHARELDAAAARQAGIGGSGGQTKNRASAQPFANLKDLLKRSGG